MGHFNFIEFPQIYCVFFFFVGSRRTFVIAVACIDLSFVYSLFALFIGTTNLPTYSQIENSFHFILNINFMYRCVVCSIFSFQQRQTRSLCVVLYIDVDNKQFNLLLIRFVYNKLSHCMLYPFLYTCAMVLSSKCHLYVESCQ